MSLNAFHGNKKVMIVGDNQTAKDIVEALKAENFNNVVLLDKPNTYANYYQLAEEQPDYTLFVTESAQCRVKLTKVEGIATQLGGRYVKRDTADSRTAQGFYKHHLRMIGLDPNLLGAVEIPFNEVKDIPWFYTNGSPMLHLFVPKADGVARAAVESIKDYFKR